jgi:hypothetical protein
MLVVIALRYLEAQLTHRTIPAMSAGIITVEGLRIARLEVFPSWRLDINHRVVVAAWSMCRSEASSTIGTVC